MAEYSIEERKFIGSGSDAPVKQADIDAAIATHGADTSTHGVDKVADAGSWASANESWAFASVDDPTGIITVPSGATSKYSLGMRIKFTNGGNVIKGIITAITDTSLTFLHEIDPADSLALTLMANSAITANYYSSAKAPFGFPLEPSKWTIEVVGTADVYQTNPVGGTYYELDTNVRLVFPIGCWKDIDARVQYYSSHTSTGQRHIQIALSTSNSSRSDTRLYHIEYDANAGETFGLETVAHISRKEIEVAVKTTYYLITGTAVANMWAIYNFGGRTPTVVSAVLAYL